MFIPVSVFPSCPSFPSVFKNRGPRYRSSADVDHRPSRWFGSRCFCPFLPSCFPYGHSGRCENPNEFAKIKVNQGKSNLFFLFQLLTPKFKLMVIPVSVFPSCPSFPSVFKNRGPRYRSSTDTLGTKWEGRRVAVPNWPALHTSCPVANRPFFKNTKITKRTQFKKPHHPLSPPAAEANLRRLINGVYGTDCEQTQNP
jgi:hypothetical protein